jgi:NitT/TauT family transport system ATP-binding protein
VSTTFLEVERLDLGYRSRREGTFAYACRDLTFEVRRGEFVAVVGPSGCGKTTFLEAVAGLNPVIGGTLALDGKPISGPAQERSLVFQQASLFPWRTVRDNVVFGLEAQHKLTAETRRRVEDLIALVGLAGREDAYPGELSGGMMQRVNLARALATDPKLLLLDEPFSALDAQTRETLQEELTRIWQSTEMSDGKTAVFITHDVPEAVFLADRVVVFSAGPAQVAEIVDIDLPRPRDPKVKRSDAFLGHVDHILGLVMSHQSPQEGDRDELAATAGR